MAIVLHRGRFALIHAKELKAVIMTHKWSRSDQLYWLGRFLLGKRRRND